MPLVDIVAWPPVFGESPEYEVTRDYYYAYPSIVQDIKDVATAHGFEGEFEADELTYSTTGTAIPDQPWAYSYTVAAKYSGRALLMHLGVDVSVSLGGGSGHLGRNLCTAIAGAEATTFPVGIQTSVTNTAANVLTYAFSLPDDDRLVALWTNGIAVEYDRGSLPPSPSWGLRITWSRASTPCIASSSPRSRARRTATRSSTICW
jgi:hypothetical protein